ncbi:MAG: helix-turn-helix transcriptional regulator, partial [Pseudomonadota bacterium]
MQDTVGVGARVRAKRLKIGLKQAALAQDIGISATYLNLIEHGKRRISPSVLDRLAVCLDTPISDLTEGPDSVITDQLVESAVDFGASESLETAQDFA